MRRRCCSVIKKMEKVSVNKFWWKKKQHCFGFCSRKANYRYRTTILIVNSLGREWNLVERRSNRFVYLRIYRQSKQHNFPKSMLRLNRFFLSSFFLSCHFCLFFRVFSQNHNSFVGVTQTDPGGPSELAPNRISWCSIYFLFLFWFLSSTLKQKPSVFVVVVVDEFPSATSLLAEQKTRKQHQKPKRDKPSADRFRARWNWRIQLYHFHGGWMSIVDPSAAMVVSVRLSVHKLAVNFWSATKMKSDENDGLMVLGSLWGGRPQTMSPPSLSWLRFAVDNSSKLLRGSDTDGFILWLALVLTMGSAQSADGSRWNRMRTY